MLNGKTALVTGASRGIGRAIAVELARQGADVAVVYAGNTEAAAETCRQCQALGVKAAPFLCDVGDYAQVETLIQEVSQRLGPVAVLVNNAGINRDKLAARMSETDFADVLRTNLTGAFNLIRHTYASFLKNRWGRIINITSVTGLCGNAGQANYAAAKAGLVGLTKSIAKELGGRGITCNAIAPGLIDTDMTRSLPATVQEHYLQNIPLKRWGQPEDVAHVAAFLASEEAGYITGTVIQVDGGLNM